MSSDVRYLTESQAVELGKFLAPTVEDETMMSRRAVETDQVDWTLELLEQRIRETEALLQRIGSEPRDVDFVSIRQMLTEDLVDKQGRLKAFAGRACRFRSWIR